MGRSRRGQPLGLQAEQRYPVSPLALPAPVTPADADALAGVNAVALFCARARARDPCFDLDDLNAPRMAEICRRVDGLPLAISWRGALWVAITRRDRPSPG